MVKTMRYVATNTGTTIQTVSVPSGEGGNFQQYTAMDVVCVVNTLVGGGSVDISIQEYFAVTTNSTTGFFLTTAKARGVTSTTQFIYMTYGSNNQAFPYAVGTQQNPMLNKGMQKQVVTSTNSTITAMSVDTIFVYWNM